MSLTQSTMLDLGHAAPDFNLPSTDGTTVQLSDFSGSKALVVIFMCNHCPYVVHIAPALAPLAQEYMSKGVAFVGINSNDVEAYPADSFEKMVEEKAKRGYPFPYLFDETQAVAQAYSAACTPDIYVFDEKHKLVYRGQFDDTRPTRIASGHYESDTKATGKSLQQALDVILSGRSVPDKQYPSIGCNIKWKPGNEPQ